MNVRKRKKQTSGMRFTVSWVNSVLRQFLPNGSKLTAASRSDGRVHFQLLVSLQRFSLQTVTIEDHVYKTAKNLEKALSEEHNVPQQKAAQKQTRT